MGTTWERGRVLVFGVLVLSVMPACKGSSSSGDDDDDNNDSNGGASRADCEGVCGKLEAADCTGFDHDSCIGGCASFADMQKDTSTCDLALAALIDCYNGLTDICLTNTLDPDTGKYLACNAEAEDFARCYSDYCQDHTSADYCN